MTLSLRKNKWKLAALTGSVMGGLALLSGCDSGGGGASGTQGASACAIPRAHPLASQLASLESQSHIPAAVRNFSDQGKLSETQMLPVTLALKLNNQAELEQKIGEIYQPGQPGNAKLHQFITPEEFRARYAPTAEQVSQVQGFLQTHGIRSGSINANGYLLQANGSAKALNEAFQTEVHQYRDGNGNSYFAPSMEPTLPGDLSIQAVHGLQNVTRWHSHAIAHPVRSTQPNANGNGPNGTGYSPSDIRTAYQIPSSATGAGQTLALMELDGYTASDITAYETQFGLANVPLQNVLVDGSSGSAGGGAGEVTLDIELMTAIAPGASKILVYEGSNSDQGILDVYAKIANDNQAKEISSSWGSSEVAGAFTTSENTIFMQMAAQGQAIFAASGDSGANDNGSGLSVDDPANQPYVVGVGGTTLTTGTGGAYATETTWNNPSGSITSGGGGVSSVWAEPSWQAGLATSQNLASSTMRNVPDVSLNADPATGYSIYEAGSWGEWGGTSCAAPLWAAFMALVNQRRQANGFGLLGFPSPALYGIGRGATYGSDFHDIADGSTNGHYPATPGYDDATGWGSFNGQGLLNSLSQDATPTGC